MALACVLSGVAHAGEMHSTGAVAPPTPSTVNAAGEIHSTGATAPGEIPSTGATEPGEIPTTGATALTIILTLISIVP
jgi:hypothetical protein